MNSIIILSIYTSIIYYIYILILNGSCICMPDSSDTITLPPREKKKKII